jgi:transposase
MGRGRLRDRSFNVGHGGARLCRSVGARDEPRLSVQAPRCRRGARRGHAPPTAQRDRPVPLEVVDDRLARGGRRLPRARRRQDELDARRAARPRRGCRSTRPTTVAAASSPPRLRPRPPPRGGGARRPQSAVGGALPALARERHGRSRSSRSTPTRPTAKRSTNELPWAWIVGDHFHLVRGAKSAVDSVRRARQREAGSRRPKGVRRSGQWARWRPELYAAATACSMPGTTTRAAAALSTVRARSRGSRGVGAQGGLPPGPPCTRSLRRRA